MAWSALAGVVQSRFIRPENSITYQVHTQREREREEEEVQGDWIQPPITKKKRKKNLEKTFVIFFNDNKELLGPSQFEIKTNDL